MANVPERVWLSPEEPCSAESRPSSERTGNVKEAKWQFHFRKESSMIHHHRRSKTQSIKKLAALNISSLKKLHNYHLTGKWLGAFIGTWKLLGQLKCRQMMKILLFLTSKDNWWSMHYRRSINSDLNLAKTVLKQNQSQMGAEEIPILS